MKKKKRFASHVFGSAPKPESHDGRFHRPLSGGQAGKTGLSLPDNKQITTGAGLYSTCPRMAKIVIQQITNDIGLY
jgi:hypothetical protein